MGERYSLSACIYGAVFVEGFTNGRYSEERLLGGRKELKNNLKNIKIFGKNVVVSIDKRAKCQV